MGTWPGYRFVGAQWENLDLAKMVNVAKLKLFLKMSIRSWPDENAAVTQPIMFYKNKVEMVKKALLQCHYAWTDNTYRSFRALINAWILETSWKIDKSLFV